MENGRGTGDGATTMGLAGAGRVLVLAEDDEDMRGLLAAHLRTLGCTVVEARDGIELLDQIDATARDSGRGQAAFAALVADNQMPGLLGLDVLAALGGARWEVPFILISALADEATCEEAQALGAAAVLAKPLDGRGIRAALRAAMPSA